MLKHLYADDDPLIAQGFSAMSEMFKLCVVNATKLATKGGKVN